MARQPIPQLALADRLQVSAAPVQSYVQPAEASGGESLLRALSSFSPALGQFADRMSEEGRAKAEAAVEGKIGGMTFAEFKAARDKDPAMGFTGPWARAALDKQFGTRLGHEVRRGVEAELAQADPMTADADEITARHVKEASSALGDSKFAVAGFQGIASGLADKAKDVLNAKRIQATVETRNDNAAENMLGTIEWAAGEGADPEAMLHVLRTQYQHNRDVLGISYAEQDKVAADVMRTLAQRPGMKGYIEKMGELDRDGVKLSTKLGPSFQALVDGAEAKTMEHRKDGLQSDISQFTLAADAGQLDEATFDKFAEKNLDILGGSFVASMKIRNKNAQEQEAARSIAAIQAQASATTLTALTPDLSSAARQGRIADVGDFSTTVAGKDVSFSRKDLVEHGLKTAAQAIMEEGTAQKLDPKTIRQNVVSMYAANGQVDPDAEARISALLHGTAAGGDVPASVLNYLPELAAVDAVAPHMIDRIVGNEQDRLFLDTITTGMELGVDPQQALKTAVWRRDNKQLIAMPTGSARTKMAKEITDGLKIGSDNPALVSQYVEDRMDYFYATGASGGFLKKRVIDSFHRTHAELNGHLIDVSGTGLGPGKALPVLTDAADAIKEAKPEFAKEDVTFIPMGRGSDRFMAVTATGIPIPGTQRTWAEMSDLHTKRRADRLKATAAAAKKPQHRTVLPGIGVIR